MFGVFGPGNRRSTTVAPVRGSVRGAATAMPIGTVRSPR